MEIKGDLKLTIEETTLIDMHSVCNILNVITYELLRLMKEIPDAPELESLCDANAEMGNRLRDPEKAYRMVTELDTYASRIEEELKTLGERHQLKGKSFFEDSLENIRSILDIMRIRAAEIAARSKNPDAWVDHNVAQLRQNFVHVLQAIERNSHGGYRIVYNIAEHEEKNYFVSFEISAPGPSISMPAVLQDVVRDLIANARKYTAPGGKIIAGLSLDEEKLRFVVSDDGRGIPPAEIERVVLFGERGSNVSDRPTRGGGFGLTKAYYVTRKFGGRMWIDSKGEEGQGTRIEITIPRSPSD